MTVGGELHARQYSSNRVRRSLLAPALILLGIMACCSPASGATGVADPDSGPDRLRVCIPADVDAFDPTNFRSRITQVVLKNIFDSLTARDQNNTVIPRLAVSWRLVDDTYWQFKLRPGVRFHNGQPFSAADVKFTLDRVIGKTGSNGQASPRQGLLAPVSEVVVEDELTVGIKTRFPWPNLPLMLALQEIVPSVYFQAAGASGFEAHPIGTGPFMFIRTDPGKEILLERFEGYYGGPRSSEDRQWVPVKHLIFSVLPSDLDRVAMLKSGRCDIILNLPPKSVPIIETLLDLRVVKSPATRSYFAEFNCTRPPFDDRRVRQALNYAVDIDSLVKYELQGSGVRLPTVLLTNAFGFDAGLRPYTCDMSAARRLLASTIHDIHRPILIFANHDDLSFAGTIALGLTKLGWPSHVVLAPSFRPRKTGPEADWDIFVGSWGNTSLDPAGILMPKFKTNGNGNFSGFASAALDRLMDRAQSTMDPNTRLQLYHEIQGLIFQEAPMIFGYAQDEYYGVARRVKHFSPSATGMLDLHNVCIDERP